MGSLISHRRTHYNVNVLSDPSPLKIDTRLNSKGNDVNIGKWSDNKPVTKMPDFGRGRILVKNIITLIVTELCVARVGLSL